MKKCMFCAEEIQDEALKCRFCGSMQNTAPREKWYFKPPALVTAFLCVGPLMLPLVWMHPRFSPAAKIAVTVLILAISFALGIVFMNALKAVSGYYRMISNDGMLGL